MIAIYVRRINEEIMTLEEVPPRWKDAVEIVIASYETIM